jgi:putative phosphoesterase
MKFVVISDIHDNLVNLEKCIKWGKSQGIENAICCGDVVNSETLQYLAENFKVMYLIRGNLEIYDAAEIKKYDNYKTVVASRLTANFLLRNSPAQSGLKQSSHKNLPLAAESTNINYLGRFGVFEIDGKIIGLCHEPWYIDSVLKIKPCDLIFYGHTHEPWISEKDGLITANPGTLGGVFNKASFAVYDSINNNLELKILELL